MNAIAQKNETTSYYVDGYNEEVAMSYFSRSALLDPIEGIWQSTDGYKYSIEKDVENGQRLSEKYRVIVLESSYDGWKLGQIRGFITTGSVESVYSYKYYTRNIYDGSEVQSQNIFLIVESPVIMSYSRVDRNGKISMYRIYPKADNNGIEIGGSAENLPQWSGSGIVIGKRYIATNNHVVEDAKSLVVKGVNGDLNTSYKVQVVISDKNADVAIVKIIDEKFEGFDMLPYGFQTTTADVGTEIFVLGYPKTDIMGNEVKVTNGIISAKTGYKNNVSLYQMSAPIQPGNSGGPVFDYNGNLIGISVAHIPNAQNVNYAVKLSCLQTLVESCNEDIELSGDNIISSFSLADKVKAITPYVVMFLANTNEGESSVSQNAPQMPKALNEKQEAERLKQLSYEKYNKNDYLGAYSDIIESIKLYPTPETHFFRAWLAQNLNFDTDIDNIIESYTYCIEHEYNLETSYSGLADCFRFQCKYQEAIDMYNKTLLENKKNVLALFMRASCKSKLDDIQASIADYMRAVKYEGIVDFDYGTIYNNVAFTYVGLGNYDMAEKYIKEALKRNHLEWYIWDTDGEIAYKKGEYERCISSMNNAITIDNKNANSYYYRALANIKLGNHSGAYNDLEILNTIDMAPPKWKFDCVYNEWKEQKKEDSIKANTLKKYIDMSKVDFEQLTEDETIISCPKVTSKAADISSVKAVEISSEYTAIHLIVLFPEQSGNKNYWVTKDSYIIDKSTSDTLYLLKTENCPIWPETAPAKNGKAELVLYFPAIHKNCKEIDFAEQNLNQDSKKWFVNGICVGKIDGVFSWEDVFVTDDESAVQDMVYVKTIKKKCAYGYKNSCINSIRKEAAKENCRVVLLTGVNDAEWSTSATAKLYREP